jgi:hypothetical protein
VIDDEFLVLRKVNLGAPNSAVPHSAFTEFFQIYIDPSLGGFHPRYQAKPAAIIINVYAGAGRGSRTPKGRSPADFEF